MTPPPEATQSRVRLRPLTQKDVPACREIFDAAQRELYGRLGQPWTPADGPIMDRLLSHLAASDPELAWMAASVSRGSPPLAFAMAVRRDRFCFLSFLFVRPEAQAAGLGRRLLERCLPPTDERVVRATCVDALQPISTGLYAAYGIVPRLPLFTLLGHSPAEGLPRLPRSIVALEFDRLVEADDGHARLAAAVEGIDREVCGFARAADHRYWRLDGRRGVLYTDRSSGRALGYGYRTSGGRLGPVAVDAPGILPAVLRDLVEREQPPGRWQLLVPGVADAALVPLLRAGMRFEGSPGLFCASEASISYERYLPSSFALP